VKLEEADAEEQSGHAFHVMDAYVKSFKAEGEKGMRALSVLRLLGLFDRPATADCLNALWTGEEIGGLTGSLLGIGEAQRNLTLKRLEDTNLITVNRDKGSASLVSLDAHPLIREYFATRVREELPGAWRAAHRRLYEYLRDSTHEGDEPTLEDLQPLYEAVAHGCQAGLHQEAAQEIYYGRIQREREAYSARRLGLFGSDLGAAACFFEQPWSRLSSTLGEVWRAWLLNEAATRLRALGRLAESLEPMRVSGEMDAQAERWEGAAISSSNLSELELTLGEVARAVADAEQSVSYADHSGDAFEREADRGLLADALHHAGRRDEALKLFREVEAMQAKRAPDYPLCYSLRGFRYCDLLLAAPERAAWQSPLGNRCKEAHSEMPDDAGEKWQGSQSPLKSAAIEIESCGAVSQRAAQTLKWVDSWQLDILSASLDHLTLGRAAVYEAILEHSDVRLLNSGLSHIDAAVAGLRRAGTLDHLPRGLLTRAWLRFLEGKHVGPESAQEDLDEAWEIAERGPMRLYMADIHLYRARLFHAVKPYPWSRFEDGSEGRGPKDDLSDARKLIEQCGYWRRKEELEDAEEAAKNWD
jgi:tetratricopeptide (TPR) repeat protein